MPAGRSALPYWVDIVDWHAIGARFRRLIAAQRLPLVDAAIPADHRGPARRERPMRLSSVS
jgi:hypothetical protein